MVRKLFAASLVLTALTPRLVHGVVPLTLRIEGAVADVSGDSTLWPQPLAPGDELSLTYALARPEDVFPDGVPSDVFSLDWFEGWIAIDARVTAPGVVLATPQYATIAPTVSIGAPSGTGVTGGCLQLADVPTACTLGSVPVEQDASWTASFALLGDLVPFGTPGFPTA